MKKIFTLLSLIVVMTGCSFSFVAAPTEEQIAGGNHRLNQERREEYGRVDYDGRLDGRLDDVRQYQEIDNELLNNTVNSHYRNDYFNDSPINPVTGKPIKGDYDI